MLELVYAVVELISNFICEIIVMLAGDFPQRKYQELSEL